MTAVTPGREGRSAQADEKLVQDLIDAVSKYRNNSIPTANLWQLRDAKLAILARLAAKPADEGVREATIDKILFDFEGKFRRFDYKERDWLRERLASIATAGKPKP